jgi:PEP-CTERM motif
MKTIQKITAILAALLISAQASAIQISGSGDSWTTDWFVDASITPGLTQDLTATSDWLVSSYSSTQIILDVTITNTTLLTGLLTNADITSFGFGVSPNAQASLLTAGTTFTQVGTGSGPQQNYPGGFKGIDVCIFFQNCSGGSAPNGLRAGETDSLKLLLTGNFGSTTELLFFPAKFQTNQGSYEPGGCINCGSNNAPEPSILALLGIGLALVGFAHRRRQA